MNQLKSEFEEKSKKIEYEKELAFKNIEVGHKNIYQIDLFPLFLRFFLTKIKNTRIQNKQEIDHLKKLQELNINLTEYLIGSIQKTDKLVKIVNNKGDSGDKGSSFANIHFHE